MCIVYLYLEAILAITYTNIQLHLVCLECALLLRFFTFSICFTSNERRENTETVVDISY